MQTSTLDLSSTLDAIDRTMGSARALNNLLHQSLWSGYQPTKDDADGIGDLFDSIFRDMDTELADLRGAVKKPAATVAAAPTILRGRSAGEMLAEAAADKAGEGVDPASIAAATGLPLPDVNKVIRHLLGYSEAVKPIDFEGEVTGAADAERAERIKRTVDKLTKKEAPDDDAGAAGRTGTDE